MISQPPSPRLSLRPSLRRGAWLFVAVVLASCEREPEPAAIHVPAPVAAPLGLMFDGVVPAPQVLWEQVRSGLGEAGRVLPKHFPLLVTELMGVSPLTSGRFETQLPIRLAVDFAAPESSADPGLGWCVALPVTSGGELLADLTTGSRAAYHRVEHDGVIELAKPGLVEFPARGVRGNRLMLASDSRALKALAPYLATNELESSHRANAHGLTLVSRPGVGAELARAYDAWLSAEGGQIQSDWFESSLPTGSGPVARLLDALTEQLSSGMAQTLKAVESSKLDLHVEGEWLKIDGTQLGPLDWEPSEGVCEVVAKAPLDAPTASLVWGGDQRVDLSITSSAGEGVAMRGPFQLGIGQLPEANPAVGGAAPSHVAYADVGWVGPSNFVNVNAWLLGLVSESGFSLSALDVAGLPSVGAAKGAAHARPAAFSRAWEVRGWSESRRANLTVAEVVLTSIAPARGTFWVGPGVATATGPGVATGAGVHPWSESCSQLMFGVAVGHGRSRVSLWGAKSRAGFDLRGALPLRAVTGF